MVVNIIFCVAIIIYQNNVPNGAILIKKPLVELKKLNKKF